jgi:uncharacterized membrane protein YedE/YeeE
MSTKRFLLWMLASIFGLQVGIFMYAAHYCVNNGGLNSCPNIHTTYEKTFNVAIATVLALLTGSAMKE